MATTLSLVVIFLPVAFMTGYARRYIYPFGWTMAFADHGVDARQLHADADAELALPAAGRRDEGPQDEGQRLLPPWIAVLLPLAALALAHPSAIIAVSVVAFRSTFR